MKKVPLASIVVVRDGKSISPRIGKAVEIDGKMVGVGEPFDFEKEEIDDMDRMGEYLGSPVYLEPHEIAREPRGAAKHKSQPSNGDSAL